MGNISSTSTWIRVALLVACNALFALPSFAQPNNQARAELIRRMEDASRSKVFAEKQVSDMMALYGAPKPSDNLKVKETLYKGLLDTFPDQASVILPWLLDTEAMLGNWRELLRLETTYYDNPHDDGDLDLQAYWGLAQAKLGNAYPELTNLIAGRARKNAGDPLNTWPTSSSKDDMLFNCLWQLSYTSFGTWESHEYWLKQAIAIRSNEALVHDRLAEVLASAGQFAGARVAKQKAVDLATGEFKARLTKQLARLPKD